MIWGLIYYRRTGRRLHRLPSSSLHAIPASPRGSGDRAPFSLTFARDAAHQYNPLDHAGGLSDGADGIWLQWRYVNPMNRTNWKERRPRLYLGAKVKPAPGLL
jgi:hypothetical protein